MMGNIVGSINDSILNGKKELLLMLQQENKQLYIFVVNK